MTSTRGNRSRPHRRQHGLLVGALASVLLAACGGGSDKASDMGRLSTTASSGDSSPSAASAASDQKPVQFQGRSFLVETPEEAKRKAAQAARQAFRGYNVVLASPSISERFSEDEGRVRALSSSQGEGAAGAAATALRAQRMAYNSVLQNEQTQVGQRIQALGAKVVAENRAAINMVTVEATAEQADAIRGLPGVVSVSPVMVLPKPMLRSPVARTSASVSAIATTCNYDPANEEIQARKRRSSSKAELLSYHSISAAHQAGITGQNVRIAVLDDGLDYTHTAFGGPGTPAMLNRAMVYAFAPDASRLASAMFPYPGSKVLGGYDFVRNDLSPFPDFERRGPNQPCDLLDEHGTQVTDILQTVAPDARFYIYKVCGSGDTGCPDTAIVGGLNRALDPLGDGSMQRVDIVTASLGAAAGRLSTPLTIAANNVAKAGVVLTMAAGNDGPVAHALATPAVAPKGTAVAQVQGPARKRANGDPLDLAIMEYTSSSGPSTDGGAIKPEVGAIGDITTAMSGTGDGTLFFGGTSGATPVVAGVYALLMQKFPQLSPAQLRARLVNTSRPGTVWGGRAQQETVISRLNEYFAADTDWSVPAHTVRAMTPEIAAGSATQRYSRAPYQVSARTPVSVVRLGGGEVNAVNALRAPAMFYAVDDERDAQVPGDTMRSLPAAANFGKVSVSSRTTLPAKTLWVENFGPAARTFAISHFFNVPSKAASGAVSIRFSTNSVTVPAGGRVAVTMSMTIDPARLAASEQYKSARGFIEPSFAEPRGPYRQFADECVPTDAVCHWLDSFDGRIELRDASETLRLPWYVMPLRGSEVVAWAAVNSDGQRQLTVSNQGTSQSGIAEIYDWLGSHGPDNARVRQGRLHILAWGAREARYTVKSAEVSAGLLAPNPSNTRRVIQVAYLLDRNSFFSAGGHLTFGTGDVLEWGASRLKLGIDVDGDGTCGNQELSEFRFRAPLPGESEDAYDEAYRAAQKAFLLSLQRVNRTLEGSDYVLAIQPSPVVTPTGVDVPSEPLNLTDPVAFGSSNLFKSTSQVIRGRHLSVWNDDQLPALFPTNLLNIAGVGVDYRSGILVSFIVPIDDSPQWFTNRAGNFDSTRFISKPGSPAPVIGGTAPNRRTAFGREHWDNLVEGVRLNPGQTRVTLCPMIGDTDVSVDKAYPPQEFQLGSPRFQVQGITPAVGSLSVAPGGQVVRNITVNNAAHPALGLFVRSWNDRREVNLVTVP